MGGSGRRSWRQLGYLLESQALDMMEALTVAFPSSRRDAPAGSASNSVKYRSGTRRTNDRDRQVRQKTCRRLDKVLFRQIGNVMDIGFDMTRIEYRSHVGRNQVAMIHQADPITAAQPSRRLFIGDMHVAMFRKEGPQRTQVVQEFATVAVAAFHIAVSCKPAGVLLSPKRVGGPPLGPLCQVSAVDPQVNDIDPLQCLVGYRSSNYFKSTLNEWNAATHGSKDMATGIRLWRSLRG